MHCATTYTKIGVIHMCILKNYKERVIKSKKAQQFSQVHVNSIKSSKRTTFRPFTLLLFPKTDLVSRLFFIYISLTIVSLSRMGKQDIHTSSSVIKNINLINTTLIPPQSTLEQS
jgi:hypothetical protein